jgi:hypothetical protein
MSKMHNSKLRRSWKLRWNILVALTGILFEQLMFRLGLIACASKLNYSQACEQAQLNATTTTVGNAGLLYIYSGAQPSGPAGADGTLVAGPFTMGTPFAPGASAALPSVLSPTLPANVNAAASVQPTWWRIKTSGAVAVLDGSAGVSAADMTIGTPTSGQPVAITGFTITSGNSGH